MLLHITGAAGSGTSTLAQALAVRIGAAHLEADDYYWMPTQPPYTQKRDPAVRGALLRDDLHTEGGPAHSVVAGSIVGWGPELENAFDLIVFLYLEPAIRVERLRLRETERFGEANPAFLAWAAQYDHGPLEGRGLARHRAWLAERRCPVLVLDGDLSVDERVEAVLDRLRV